MKKLFIFLGVVFALMGCAKSNDPFEKGAEILREAIEDIDNAVGEDEVAAIVKRTALEWQEFKELYDNYDTVALKKYEASKKELEDAVNAFAEAIVRATKK